MRINKYLAECGFGSRRKCEQLVTDGRVKLNGRLVKELATDINEEKDIVSVDGKNVERPSARIYLMLNKPKGYICTTADEKGRKTVLELLNNKYAGKRIYPVGRLDYETEGLLILTDDGDTANRIMHPRNEVPKTYVAKIEGEIDEKDLDIIRRGVILDGVKTKKCKVKLLDFSNNVSRLEVVISEGRNRQVRRMFESINREVVFLKRVAIGELKLGGLFRGEYRELNEKEINYLKNV